MPHIDIDIDREDGLDSKKSEDEAASLAHPALAVAMVVLELRKTTETAVLDLRSSASLEHHELGTVVMEEYAVDYVMSRYENQAEMRDHMISLG